MKKIVCKLFMRTINLLGFLAIAGCSQLTPPQKPEPKKEGSFMHLIDTASIFVGIDTIVIYKFEDRSSVMSSDYIYIAVKKPGRNLIGGSQTLGPSHFGDLTVDSTAIITPYKKEEPILNPVVF